MDGPVCARSLSPGNSLWAFSFYAADLVEGTADYQNVSRILAAVAALHVYLIAIPILMLVTVRRLGGDKGSPRQRRGKVAMSISPPATVFKRS